MPPRSPGALIARQRARDGGAAPARVPSRPRARWTTSRASSPASRVVTVTTRGRIAPLATERPELPHVHRVVQPHYRGRAAETLLPLLRIARQDPSATVVVVPADHGVRHEARFHRYVARAVRAVALRPDLPILIGAHPHAPVTSGWIEPGAPVEGLEDLSVHAVKRVVDTTSLAEQRRLFESGALISTLVFVGRAGTLLELAAEALPEVLEALEPLADAFGTPEEPLLREAVYECMPRGGPRCARAGAGAGRPAAAGRGLAGAGAPGAPAGVLKRPRGAASRAWK